MRGSNHLSDVHSVDVDAPAGLQLSIRTAQHSRFPSVTLQRVDGHTATYLYRLTPTQAAELGAQLIAGWAIASGRLDACNVDAVLQAAQLNIALQVEREIARVRQAHA